jgi:hypothetical protein
VVEIVPVLGSESIPYGALHNALARGRVIPFLGAGASMERREEDENWSLETKERFTPSGKELAARLASLTSFPDTEIGADLARVAQYADLRIGRELLSDGLAEVFNPSPESSGLHRYLASLDEPMLIITTNYDDMIESAFTAADRPFHLVIQTLGPGREHRAWLRPAGANDGSEVDEVEVDLKAATTIYKLHGSALPSPATNYLISEDDYLRFLQRMMTNSAIPLIFSNQMRSYPFLFIGYSLVDWNLRLLLYQLRDFIEKSELMRPSWAIMPTVSDVDRRLWEDRGVNLFRASVRDFVNGMVTARDKATGS